MKPKKGQALITLVIFTVMASILIAAAVAVSVGNAKSTGILADSEEVFKLAEAGMENATLRLLRDPNYAGETLTVGNGTATITVTGTNPKTITSEGSNGTYRRKIQATATTTNTVVTISGWSEVP